MNITLIFSSFVAGMLTILAPCILTLLPVIIGSTASSKDPSKPFIVTASLGVSIVIFTLLLKASTIFISVPPYFWNYLSGGIVLLFGIFLIFPNVWELISVKLGFSDSSHALLHKAGDKDSILGSVLIGAALGPVFSSCSPTYFIILATVLPVSFLEGLIYLIVYAFGLTLILGLIGYFGQRIIIKLKWAANPKGIFKKSMGVLLILVGIFIITGYDKVVETKILNSKYNVANLENELMNDSSLSEKYQDYSFEKEQQAQAKDINYALFFHADWCTTCQAMEKDIYNNINKLPKGSIIFKVNYDTAYDLKEKYKVLTQTTVIFFDGKGNIIDRKINPGIDRIIKSLSGNIGDRKRVYYNPKTKAFIDNLKNKKKSFANFKEYFNFLKNEKALKQATFAGGCFWCMEGAFEAEFGVIETFSGYSGGNVVTPSYEEVSSGKTGAREVVDIFYDPRAISYEKLLEIYWRQIDPTDRGGQFADRGTQYTTAIFYHNKEQEKLAENSKKALENSGKFVQIATLILPFENFYVAEEYHQDFYKKSAERYNKYKVNSGRDKNIKENKNKFDKIFKNNYVKPNEAKIKSMLTDEAFAITQKGMTERPFHNEYWNKKDPGIYVDVVTGEPLFSSTDKFDSGTGWPSFTRPIDDNFITEHEDNKIAVSRTEIKSKVGGSHLGHVFNDGPIEKGGMRYCINSAALRFVPLDKMEEEGYGKYLFLFKDYQN